MTYLNPPGQRGKYSVQAFSPAAVFGSPQIWEVGTTNDLQTAEEFAAMYACRDIETKIVERTDRYSNIGTILGVWFDGKRREGT